MYDFTQNEWGLVLSGGGGKGAYQAGVFRALKEKGISDVIIAGAGASVGALNLALFAMGDMKISETIWGDISPEQFLTVNPDLFDLQEGFVSREGLLDIIDEYVNLDIIRDNEKRLYVSTTEYDNNGEGDGIVKYFSLNYRPDKEIKDILLASTAMPVIYSPVEIGGKLYRDGGIKDNLPIKPLYIEGIRNFIVVGLSTDTKINYEKFPDANFLFIKPRKSIGEFWDGTLDFTSKGAKIRMEVGYMDAVREIEFFGRNDSASKMEYEMRATNDYKKLEYKYRQINLQDSINTEMDKINALFNKYK